MDERKFRPHFPITPEEREEASKAGKPKLLGAPSEAHESILLANEEGLPLLQQVGNDLKAYKAISQNEKKKDFRRVKFNNFINKPEELEAYFDTLNVLSQSWEDRTEEIEAYKKEYLDNLEKLVGVGNLSPEALKGWLRLMVKSEVYRPIAEKVFKVILEKLKTPQAVIGFMYNLAQALYSIDDKEVLKKGYEVFVGNASFLQGESDGRILNYIKAIWTLDDDVLLTKAIEVDTTIYRFGQYMPEAFNNVREKIASLVDDNDFQNFSAQMVSKHRDKFKQLSAYYTRGAGKTDTILRVSTEDLATWPYTIIVPGGKVRELCNQRAEQENEGKYVSLHLPDTGLSLVISDEALVNIVDNLNKKPKGSKELRDTKYLKTLFYISPEISKQNQEALSDDVVVLRQQINHDKSHGISPRGDKMLIMDQEILKLGIKSITFKVEEHAPSVTVFIEVGNYEFVLTLNPNLETKDVKGDPISVSFERKAFIEHLILSHLKELMCTERVKSGIGEANGNGKHQVEREKEFKDRRPHLRKMAPNNAYSQEALAQGLADPQRWDLARINAELGLTKEVGQKTYVRVFHEPLSGELPLVSRAPHATDRLKEILKKVEGVE